MMFDGTHNEDEPCDGCGAKPSVHMGHGSFSCEACFNAWWCPKCGYDQRRQPHVCPTPEEKRKRRIESKAWDLSEDGSYENNITVVEMLLLAEELTREEQEGSKWETWRGWIEKELEGILK